MNYSILDAELDHVSVVADSLNDEDRDTLLSIGLEPRGVMGLLFHGSCYRKTAILEGVPVALWGVTGTLMSCDGEVWLALTDAARAFPMYVARIAARELSELMGGHTELRSSILCRNAQALRFARFLGFEIVEQKSVPIEHFEAVLR